MDELFAFGLFVAGFFGTLIAGLLLYLGLKYRRRAEGELGQTPGAAPPSLEIVWSAVPLGILLFMFYWGADVFFELSRPPAGADEYFVVGRQWMWKVQHPDGPREINELHAPVGRAIKLTMTSEDVIHSFYVPAFRIKMDVLPGRYTTTWFKATAPGTYHLFCAEYCGTAHSRMGGRIVVMEPHDYETWLSGGKAADGTNTGEELFQTRGCATCHRADSAARAPLLAGLTGKTVELASGERVLADDAYVRESIIRPAAKVVAGYPANMPAYEGQLSEEEIMLLVRYVQSTSDVELRDGGPPDGGAYPDGGSVPDAGSRDAGLFPDAGLPDAAPLGTTRVEGGGQR